MAPATRLRSNPDNYFDGDKLAFPWLANCLSWQCLVEEVRNIAGCGTSKNQSDNAAVSQQMGGFMSTGFNPYATPKSHVEDQAQAMEAGALRETPQSVGVGQGLAWISEGWRLFSISKGTWIGIFVVYCILLFISSLIPFASNVLNTVLLGGVMLGCRALDQGDELRIGHLFAGFSKNVGSLLLLGVLMLVFILLAAVVAGVFTIGGAAGIALLGKGDPSVIAGAGATAIMLFALVWLALVLPISLAVWFAPALIVLHDVPVLQAMLLSFKGALRNIIPSLLYSIVLVVLILIAIIPLGLGLLVLGPVIFASVYAAYKDIFEE